MQPQSERDFSEAIKEWVFYDSASVDFLVINA